MDIDTPPVYSLGTTVYCVVYYMLNNIEISTVIYLEIRIVIKFKHR